MMRRNAQQPVDSQESSAVLRNPGGLRLPVRRLALCGAVVMFLVGFVGWKQGLEDRFVPKRFGVVVPDCVYRSGQISKWQIGKVLDEQDIQVIVDLNGRDPADEHQQAELAAAKSRGIPVKRFQLGGHGLGDLRCYAAAVEEMAKAVRENRPLLIHCHAGSTRTGAAVAFYRLLVLGWRPEAAVAEMRRYSWRPHESGRLIRFMNANMQRLAEMLVQRGVLKKVPERIPRLKVTTD